MEIIREKINLYVENSKKFEGFYLCICFHQPLEKDTVTKNRLLSLVLGYGCEKYKTPTTLNTALASINGVRLSVQTVKKGNRTILQFLITAPKGNEEAVFSLLSNIINKPYIKNDDFAISRKQYLKSIIKNKIADQKNYALDKCVEIMFENKGFGIDGDGNIEDLKTIKNLYNHYLYVYNNSQVDCFAIGDIRTDRIIELVDKYFPDLISKELSAKCDKPLKNKKVIEKKDTAQAKLCIGLDMGEGNRFEKIIYNEALGGGSGSALFNVVREQNNLCYYINSTFYSLPDAMFIQAGIQPESFEKTVELIEEQLSHKVDMDEIELAKHSVMGRLHSIKDYPVTLMDFYLTQGIFDDGVTLEQAINNISEIADVNIKPEISTIYLLGGLDA